MRCDLSPFGPFGIAHTRITTGEAEPHIKDEPRRGRSMLRIDARRTGNPMNRAPSLAAERPKHLTLVPRDAIVAAVEEKRQAMHAFDERTAPPHDPTCSPLQIGDTRKFRDPYGRGRIGRVITLLGGEEVIVIVPQRADTKEVDRSIRELVDTVRSELEPAPVDD